MIHLNRNSAIQRSSRRFCTVYKSDKSDPLQPFGRRDIPSGRYELSKASSVRTTRTFCSDLALCQEALNCSSVFDQLQDFFPKHRYGKIAANVRTMWIPFRTRSSIRQVGHSKFRRPDVSLYGPDARDTYMEIACIWSTIRTTIPLVRACEALIWKLCIAKVRPGNTVRT
jgi:hypothetical protein